MKKTLKGIALALVIAIISGGIYVLSLSPSNERDWSPDNAVLATAEFDGDMVTIRNVRNYRYRSVLDFDQAYYDKKYDLSKLRTVDFFNEPFSGIAAHTFLSFGFEGGEYVTVSVEVRREKGEFFNAWKGLVRQFELIYIIADERDVVQLRTNYRKGDVYRYPIKISPAKARALFVDMLNRANALGEQPEFYHTLSSNCTTNIVYHVNNIAEPEARIPFSWRWIVPTYSASLAYDLGLVDSTGTFQEMQQRFLITPKAQKAGDSADFSRLIREL